MNPPEVIPEEDTEVETDFWMIRRGIKAYIDQLLEQFMKTDWDGMEETMKEIKNEIARIREEGGGNE